MPFPLVICQSPGLSAVPFVNDLLLLTMVYFSVLRMEEINSSVSLVLDTHCYEIITIGGGG